MGSSVDRSGHLARAICLVSELWSVDAEGFGAQSGLDLWSAIRMGWRGFFSVLGAYEYGWFC